MSRRQFFIVSALVSFLFVAPAVHAASFGTLNFFYAPGNVITPLPGYTTSWGSGGSGFSTTSADYFVSQRAPWTIAQGGTGTTTGGVTGGLEYYNGSYRTNSAALTTDGAGNIYSGVGSPQFVYGATSTLGVNMWAVVNPTIAKPLLYLPTTGGAVITSNSNYALVVGPNGTSTPAFTVDASASNAANGVVVRSTAAGGGVTISATSSSANENIALSSSGTGNININTPTTGGQINTSLQGTNRISVSSVTTALANNIITMTDVAQSSASNRLQWSNSADGNIATSTQAKEAVFNFNAATRTWGGGVVATQDDMTIVGGTHAMNWMSTSGSNFTNLNTVEISYPLVGNNATSTNSSAINIVTTALNASTTNSYGLRVNATTGAGNNYSASTTGRFVMSGLTSDSSDVGTLCETSAGEVVLHTTTGCITSSERFKTDIAPLDDAANLTEALAMRPVSYEYKPGDGPTGPQVGFIAEEMVKIDPRLVPLDSQGLPFTVNYQQLTAVLDGAIRAIENQVTGVTTHQSEQDAEIAQLQQEVAALKNGETQNQCLRQ